MGRGLLRTRARQHQEDPLFDDVRRAVGGRNQASEKVWPSSANLAGLKDLAFDFGVPSEKLPIGVAGSGVRPRLDKKTGRTIRFCDGGTPLGVDDDRNAMVVQGSRYGKTASTLGPILATYSGNTAVIDPKLDLFSTYAPRRAAMGFTPVGWDPAGVAAPEVDRYRTSINPLQAVDLEDVDDVVLKSAALADALMGESPGGDTQYWTDQARLALGTFIAYVLTSEECSGRRTLRTVYRLVMRAMDKELGERMTRSTAASGYVQDGAYALFSKSEKELSGVLSSIRLALAPISIPSVARSLEDSDFRFSQLPEGRVSLFAGVPVTMLGTMAGLLRAMVTLMLSAFESSEARLAHQRREGGPKCLIVIDECAALGRISSLETAAGHAAGLGCRIIPMFQDLGQCRSLYKDRYESFVANAGTLYFGGNTDNFTLNWIRDQLGHVHVESPSARSLAVEAIVRTGETGRSVSLQKHEMLATTEIMRLFDRDDPWCRQLVRVPRHGWCITQRATVWGHPKLRALMEPHHV